MADSNSPSDQGSVSTSATREPAETGRSSVARDIRASRRKFLATAATGATALAAGCFGGDGDGNGNGNGGNGNGNGEVTGTAGDGTVTLTWWHQENVPARIDVFEELNQRFMDEHPNIEVQQQPQTWAGIYPKIQSALQAGNQPDFWFNTPILAQEFHARGHLADVSEMQDELSSEYSYYDKTVQQYQYDGGQWGIPNWNKGFQYFWHEPTFSDVGTWPPSNWQEWLDGMSQVTGGDRNGFVLAASNTHFAYKQVVNMLAMKETGVFGPDGGVMFDTEATVQALDFYKQVWNDAVPDSAVNWSWPEWSRALRQGTSFSTSSYTAPMAAMDSPGDWTPLEGANPAPGGGEWGGGSNKRWVSIDGVSVFNEDKMDAITEYMKFIHRPDVYGWWMRTLNPTLFVPVHEEGMNADVYWEGAHSEQPMQRMVEIQQDLDNMAYPGFRDVHLENDTYVGEGIGAIEGSFPLGDVVNELIVNDASAQEAAEWGQSHLEDVTGIGASEQL